LEPFALAGVVARVAALDESAALDRASGAGRAGAPDRRIEFGRREVAFDRPRAAPGQGSE
jgi:hypothetical protein